MKTTLLSLAILLTTLQLNAQLVTETNVLIVACKSGTLIIDGNTIGAIEADDASKQKISFGEHYLQLKTGTEKFNLTIKVDADTKDIIKLGCTTSATIQGKRLIDKQINLSGALSNDIEQNIIGLDKDDEIILNCDVLNKKGNATISMFDYTSRREIFKKERFSTIENEKIKIPSKGIYYFTLRTDALFGKDAKLTIDRIPSPNSTPIFNTAVKTVYDTTSVEVLNTTARVYSSTNLDHSNRTAVSINLPKNTAYWTYWIGVGEEAQEKMKSFATSLSQAGKFLSANPLFLFGMQLIPSLPMVNSKVSINYTFTDSKNSRSFIGGQPYAYYTFKHANNITTDYSLIKVNAPDMVLAMSNNSTVNGENVDIKVVAFVITARMVMEE